MPDEFTRCVADFRRDHLRRVVILLAAAAWLIGAPIMLTSLSPAALAAVISFEALCFGVLALIHRGRVTTGRYAFVAGATAWSLGLIWLLREPPLLALPVLLAPLLVNQLELRPAIAVAGVLAIGSLLLACGFMADAPGGGRLWIFPLLTLLALGFARLHEENFTTLLGWAMQSTRNAIERLAEVQTHRARLVALTRDLDNAYHRLQRVNEMLVAARAEAEEARQARQQFALIVSHELRTPLNLIIGFSELMANAPRTYAELQAWPPGLYEDVQEIHRSARHLLSLVNDVLDLGKADARRLTLIKEWVTAEALVQEAAAIMQPALVEKGLWLRTEVADGLPAIFVDRTRIRQVLINLLGNSLRFTEQGGITISAARRPDDLLFCVEDTGPGIAPDEAAKVFEDFGQTNATVWRRRDGAGLGVPISRRLVTMHGGQMWMESEVGRGTRFYFTLPLPGAASLDLPADLDTREYWRLMADQSRAPKLVVVVSDDPSAGDLVKGWLPTHRIIAADPHVAAAQIAGLLPQAVLLDRTIAARPEVAALLESLPYDPPVLTVALPGRPAHSPEWPAGLAACLLKPVQRTELIATLRRLRLAASPLLIVDDDPAMARFVRLALAGENREAIEVIPAPTGEAALRWLAETDRLPAAILLDLSLPDMSGWTLLRRLQEDCAWRQIPVVVVTAASLPEELEARERKLLQLSTARPLTDDELAAAISALLNVVPPKFPEERFREFDADQLSRRADPIGPEPPENRAA